MLSKRYESTFVQILSTKPLGRLRQAPSEGLKEAFLCKKKKNTRSKHSEDDIIKMLKFLVDNMFVVFVGKLF